MALQLHPVLPQPDWPRQIGLEYEIRVGESLELHLTTRNDGPVAVSVSEALHSYFRIGDIRSVAIDGLDTHDYVDKLQDGQRRRQTGTLTFSSETDRIYQSAPRHCIIVDPVLNRRIHLQQDNAASTIVWNPWQKKAAQLGDLGPGHHGNGGWNDMVCVESGNALEHAVSVEPGSSHTLSVCYSVC
jgi:D-hexose-6-phosphate mutarotase